MNIGTHTSHCCARHGCKYSFSTAGTPCPVKSGEAEQEYPCEMCESPEDLRAQIADLQEELEFSLKVYRKTSESDPQQV